MRRTLLAVVAVAVIVSNAAQTGAQAPIFRFQADGFWLNLHHFLYVLGRAEAQMPDRQRRAVAGAPADQAASLPALADAQRQAWGKVVTAYSSGLSRNDTVFDRDLVQITTILQQAGDRSSVADLKLGAVLASQLEQAAPIYRKAWWPAHQKANREQVAGLQALVERDGAAVLRYVTRAYQQPWPAGGFPVNISAYSNWAGAYSTGDQLLVVSSLDPGTKGMQGLEIVFHEAMHQWDQPIYARLSKLAKEHGTPPIHDLLTHAMIFYTAGEATRSVAPAHVPYAELNGLWKQKGLGSFRPALDGAWKPYLEGKGSLDAALIALLKAQPAG
jgi:hypothetical protein